MILNLKLDSNLELAIFVPSQTNMTLIMSFYNLTVFNKLRKRALKPDRHVLELKLCHCQLGAMGKIFLAIQHCILLSTRSCSSLGSGVTMIIKAVTDYH